MKLFRKEKINLFLSHLIGFCEQLLNHNLEQYLEFESYCFKYQEKGKGSK